MAPKEASAKPNRTTQKESPKEGEAAPAKPKSKTRAKSTKVAAKGKASKSKTTADLEPGVTKTSKDVDAAGYDDYADSLAAELAQGNDAIKKYVSAFLLDKGKTVQDKDKVSDTNAFDDEVTGCVVIELTVQKKGDKFEVKSTRSVTEMFVPPELSLVMPTRGEATLTNEAPTELAVPAPTESAVPAPTESAVPEPAKQASIASAETKTPLLSPVSTFEPEEDEFAGDIVVQVPNPRGSQMESPNPRGSQTSFPSEEKSSVASPSKPKTWREGMAQGFSKMKKTIVGTGADGGPTKASRFTLRRSSNTSENWNCHGYGPRHPGPTRREVEELLAKAHAPPPPGPAESGLTE